MKTISIMRHGKTEPGGILSPDHDRRLTERGLLDVPLTSKAFAAAGSLPDHILCSSAARTVQTCALFVEAVNYKGPVTTREHLYLAQASHLCDTIRALSNEIDHIMLVGHNNGVSDLVNLLDESCAIAMPTSAIAVLTFDTGSWDTLEPGTGKLAGFYSPKQYKQQ